ncbi:hypothetical protein KAK06_14125 [Ideonella sp. 4Y11]|uniref:Uncharacterized protein n=1 Tax=Ideonella aquatica TaxID=2824119 RepID=A0A941BK26_9BURK|nr:hypothetical protein [Ideonella aquatica]MBQ0960087.1 hypothetical protein [Ideonella aquatica]
MNDLGGLFSKGWSTAQAINARGEVVGSAMPRPIGPYQPPARPVLFGQRRPLDLIAATGVDADEGDSTDINSDGHIAGYLRMNRDGSYRPFVYRQGTMEVVDAPHYAAGSPVRWSDLGHLLVPVDSSSGVNRTVITVMRRPDRTWVTTLTPWNDRADTCTVGRAINRQGSIVVGYSSKAGSSDKALVWRDNVPTPVPGTKDYRSSRASAVSDRGEIAGVHDVDSVGGCCKYRPFVVADGVLTDLLGPDLYTEVTGLDNLGRVVGKVFETSVPRAFLYQDGQTMMLDDLVEPAQPGQWQI